jgi:3-deoxy-manno-octulosonate cytidylyltransferase (CMP-KDO synthetase)
VNIIGIIPARMASSRFPGKPLADISGMPMIGHVLRRAQMCSLLDEVYVATCDKEIEDAVLDLGGTSIMTSSSHERCGDRVAEALPIIEDKCGKRADIVVLIQGDEPLVRPDMIESAIQPLLDDEAVMIANLMGRIECEKEWQDPNEVKVVVDCNSDALYFSREPIPSRAKWDRTIPMLKQICVIPHRRDFLLRFNELPATPLENIESIDMLRLLEHGYKIRMVPTKHQVVSVDTPADLERAKALMDQDNLPDYS